MKWRNILTFTLAEAKPSDKDLIAFEKRLPAGIILARFVSSLNREISSAQALSKKKPIRIELYTFFHDSEYIILF
jgi:hypothetical protein